MTVREHAPQSQIPDRNEPKRGRKVPYVALGMIGVPLAAVVGVGLWANSGSSDRSAPEPGAGTKPAATGNTIPGVAKNPHSGNISTPNPSDYAIWHGTTQAERDKMSPEEYWKIPQEVRAADDAEAFNTHMSMAMESIRPFLTPEEQQYLYVPDASKPRSKWTDQDYINANTLNQWLSTIATDPKEAQRDISAIANPGIAGDPSSTTYEFKYNNGWILQHPEAGRPGIKATYKAINGPLSNVELKNVQIGNVLIDENGGRLVYHQSLVDGEVGVTLYKNYKDAKGDVLSVDEAAFNSMNDPELSAVVAEFAPNNP